MPPPLGDPCTRRPLHSATPLRAPFRRCCRGDRCRRTPSPCFCSRCRLRRWARPQWDRGRRRGGRRRRRRAAPLWATTTQTWYATNAVGTRKPKRASRPITGTSAGSASVSDNNGDVIRNKRRRDAQTETGFSPDYRDVGGQRLCERQQRRRDTQQTPSGRANRNGLLTRLPAVEWCNTITQPIHIDLHVLWQ